MTVRLRDKGTGVVIQVDEQTAQRIGASHEPVESSDAPEPKAPQSRRKK